MQVLEHNRPCCLLLLLVYIKRTAVKSKVGVYFLYEFGEDSAFVVVWLAKVVGWSIEKCVLFAGVTMEVEIHESTVLSM